MCRIDGLGDEPFWFQACRLYTFSLSERRDQMFGSSLASSIDVSDTDKLDYYELQRQIEQLNNNVPLLLGILGFALAAIVPMAWAIIYLLKRMPKDSVGPVVRPMPPGSTVPPEEGVEQPASRQESGFKDVPSVTTLKIGR
jgi:hypothetical protein